jgi:hypothetical protein
MPTRALWLVFGVLLILALVGIVFRTYAVEPARLRVQVSTDLE